jgi:alcohol dehydrogenase
MLNKSFEFEIKTQIQFETGGINQAGATIKALGGKNVLIATDKGLLKANLLEGLIGSLKKEGLAFTIFDEVEPNPTIAVVEKGAMLFKEKGCDFLVGMGGGSSMDTAKAIGLLTSNPGPISQYEGANKVPNPAPQIIAIPTTAGTGAEINGSAVITDKDRMYKMSIRSNFLVPKVAILDPGLIITLPPHIIASTGMDALVHAIESYVSLGSSPISEALAIKSIALISENLRSFYANPANLDAAGKMILASTMAGMSFTNARLGCVHALAHSLGGYYNIAHGIACAVLLPYVMDYSLISVPAKFTRIASAMGEKTEGLPLHSAAEKAVAAVRSLLKDLDLPDSFKDFGIEPENVAQICKNAEQTGIHLSTPRKIGIKELENILRAASLMVSEKG